VLPRFSVSSGTLWALHPRSAHVPAKTRLFNAYLEEVLSTAPLTGAHLEA